MAKNKNFSLLCNMVCLQHNEGKDVSIVTCKAGKTTSFTLIQSSVNRLYIWFKNRKKPQTTLLDYVTSITTKELLGSRSVPLLPLTCYTWNVLRKPINLNRCELLLHQVVSAGRVLLRVKRQGTVNSLQTRKLIVRRENILGLRWNKKSDQA